MTTIDEELLREVAAAPYPLLFVAISGAHLYGFPSPDSDYDLRGVHLLPLKEVVGLETGPETIQLSETRRSLEIDLVTHDARKFFLLLLKKNGYVLEQLYSPLVVHTTADHEELKIIARKCITRYHGHHYRGFAHSEWNLFYKDKPHRVKPLLYIYRVLLTGIHLLRTGEVEANLPRLNQEFKLPYIEELVARKLEGAEMGVLENVDLAFHRAEFEKLLEELNQAEEISPLPPAPTGKAELNDLLIRLRLGR